MPDPLTFYVFAPSGAEARHAIEADLERYKRVKNNITVTFVDPSADPQNGREFNVNYVGQIVAEYDGRRQTLDATTEPVITTALQRLAYGGEQREVFIVVQGERSPSELSLTVYSPLDKERTGVE